MQNKRKGDIISFAKCDWRVLDIQNDKMLIITENIIWKQAYHRESYYSWIRSDVRSSCGSCYNYKGYHIEFNDIEKKKILDYKNEHKANPWYAPWYDIHSDNFTHPTIDKLFVLSLEEIVRYFGDGSSAQRLENGVNSSGCISDNNNNMRIAKYKNSCTWYWLRTPGSSPFTIPYVSKDGTISVSGDFEHIVTDVDGGVRPALWLKI